MGWSFFVSLRGRSRRMKGLIIFQELTVWRGVQAIRVETINWSHNDLSDWNHNHIINGIIPDLKSCYMTGCFQLSSSGNENLSGNRCPGTFSLYQIIAAPKLLPAVSAIPWGSEYLLSDSYKWHTKQHCRSENGFWKLSLLWYISSLKAEISAGLPVSVPMPIHTGKIYRKFMVKHMKCWGKKQSFSMQFKNFVSNWLYEDQLFQSYYFRRHCRIRRDKPDLSQSDFQKGNRNKLFQWIFWFSTDLKRKNFYWPAISRYIPSQKCVDLCVQHFGQIFKKMTGFSPYQLAIQSTWAAS